ncbi:MAG TPA: hypothetical protein VMU50_01805 [Polyangia bacterium]|nr:hypothetical protein [Polyangia bacterium]
MRPFVLALIVVSGCATTQPFVFRPTETANLTSEDRAVARYVVPRTLPRGEIFVTSEGVVASRDGHAGPALHVRALLYNVAGEAPWAVDVREQLVTLPGGVQLHADDVKTVAAGAPILAIAPGERIAMDLYFPLPESQGSAAEIPTFDFIWQVTTDRKRAAGSVPFGRVDDRGGPAADRATVATATAATY